MRYLDKKVVVLASLALAVAALGCDNNPGKDKTPATVAAPVAVAPATSGAPAPGTAKYVFSSADSKLAFTGAKVTRKHEGSLGTFSGTIQIPEGKIDKGNVTAEVDVATLTADDPKLTGHLKSPDFFDVAKFPKARFVSTSLKPGGDKGATHTVTGNLEMHGVTKSITFPATITVAGDAVNVDAEFVINRKDFAIVYPGMPDDLIKDDILMKLQIRAKKAGA